MTGSYEGERWKTARQAVFVRDDGRCQSCGRTDELHAHHVKPVRSFENPEDAHYADNLVVLCKRCHKVWEGREVRPELADGNTEATIQGVVGELTAETLWHHCFPAALPEIIARHMAGSESLCSRCLTRIGGREGFTALERMRETLRAVAFHERSIPSASPERYRNPPVESYCRECALSQRRRDESFYLRGVRDSHRESRSFQVQKWLESAGESFDYGINRHYGNEGVIRGNKFETELLWLTAAVTEGGDYPIEQLADINAHLAVTDREVKPPSVRVRESDLSWKEWYHANTESPGYGHFDVSNTEGTWESTATDSGDD